MKYGRLERDLTRTSKEFHSSTSIVVEYNLVGTTNIECERLLTDEDFKKIKRLKKRALEEKELAAKKKGSGPSIHMPSFDFLEEREKLKKMTHEMNEKFDQEEDDEDGAEEGDDEGEIIEGSDFEGEEEFEGGEEGDEEAMDEEIIEEDEMMFEDGDEEGDEEIDEDDGDEEGDEEMDDGDEVVVKGKKIEKRPSEKKNKRDTEDHEVSSSFYDDSESEESFSDPRTSFLSTNAIFDPEKVKKRKTLQEIKQGKKENRDEHLKKKLGTKIKARGRLTNQQKKKNNPFQMFIQKKRLQNRLQDLKKASKRTQKKLHKGQKPRSLGKAFGRK